MKCYCCKCGTELRVHHMMVSYFWQVECVKCGTLCTVRGKDGEEALATVGLPEKEMNLDWYRRVRTRINGQTT